MKLVDKIINKFGTDKVLHFLGGSLITAQCSIFGWWGILVGVILTFVISVIKEKLDTFFDWKDIISAMIGCVYIIIYYGIIDLIR